jgi:hypothetical protein
MCLKCACPVLVSYQKGFRPELPFRNIFQKTLASSMAAMGAACQVICLAFDCQLGDSTLGSAGIGRIIQSLLSFFYA